MRATFAILLLLLSPLPCRGAFEVNRFGPRATAFNDAYSALGSDPWAIFYNPAQITRLEGAQAAFSYSRPYAGLGGLKTNLISGLFTRSALGTGYGLGAAMTDTNVDYREMTGVLNLGQRWGEADDIWDISVGTNLKICSLRRGDPKRSFDPALKMTTLNRFTADLGAHLRIFDYFFGVSVQNVLPADMGVTVKQTLPMETRMGMGAKNIWEIKKTGLKFSPAVELSTRNKDTTASGGLAIQVLDFGSIVIGAGPRNVSLGFSILLNRFHKPVSKSAPSQKTDETVYSLDAGCLYPVAGIEASASPLIGMTFIF